ncbi:MAG: transposase [Nitrososphaerota archaeon]|nr:transposase [Nitrososphaerota archaeon]MDG6930038.1 transposase [Nitrososphaerota archaeon]MDG6931989.1 transposase [Nitrososphaerota archaeon]MDG6943808.1 transposase [Nitrososphaerota archaeon]
MDGTQEIDPFYPSTQECSHCHKRTKMPLSQCVYVCPYCGNVMDRDLDSAIRRRDTLAGPWVRLNP